MDHDKIQLPQNLDVLIYKHNTVSYVAPIVAHALQYNISADGDSAEQALDQLVGLVTRHCRDALERGSNPVCLAEAYYWRGFGLGVRILENYYAGVDVRTSVRSLCELQDQSGIYDVEELVMPVT